MKNKSSSQLALLFRLFRVLPRGGRSLFWLTLASLLINICSLAVPLFFMQVYDRIMVYGSLDTLLWLTIAVLSVLILDGVISIIRSRLAGIYAQSFSFLKEKELMRCIYNIAEDEYKTHSTSEWDDKFRNLSQLQSFFAASFFQSLLDLPFVLLFLAGVRLIAGELVYYHLAVIVVFILIQSFMRYFIAGAYKRVGNSRVKRLAFLREFLDQIHYIKAQSLEESMLRRLDAMQEDLSYNGVKLQQLRILNRFAGNMLSHLIVYCSIILGGFLILRGEMTVGVVTAATMLARRISGPLQNYGQFSLRLTQAGEELESLSTVPMAASPVEESIRIGYRISGNLELRDVSSIPRVRNGALRNVNLKAEKGTISGIYSRNPEEAETLRELLQGVRKPDDGMIMVDSYIVSRMEGLYNSDKIAILPRKGQLFGGTILENISFFNPNLSIQALDAASLLGLDDAVAAFPKGYETPMRLFSNNIVSAGIIQRIAIARALVHRPRILISDRCDELMDKETLDRFRVILSHIRDNTTIVLISSQKELLSMSDSLYILKEGSLSPLDKESLNG